MYIQLKAKAQNDKHQLCGQNISIQCTDRLVGQLIMFITINTYIHIVYKWLQAPGLHFRPGLFLRALMFSDRIAALTGHLRYSLRIITGNLTCKSPKKRKSGCAFNLSLTSIELLFLFLELTYFMQEMCFNFWAQSLRDANFSMRGSVSAKNGTRKELSYS